MRITNHPRHLRYALSRAAAWPMSCSSKPVAPKGVRMKITAALLASIVFLTGCTSGVNFSSVTSSNKASDEDGTYVDPDQPPVLPPVVDPPVLPPPVVVDPPPIKEFNATCPAGLDGKGLITSCLSCPAPITKPDLSGKAKRLLDTMDRACRISNKSQPKNYVPPTREDLIKRLQACSPEIYPDTVLTKEEEAVIPKIATGDAALLDRMFSGLWYQPPYSDAFDRYFGLGVNEAVPVLCYKTQPRLEGELWSREMWEASERYGFVFNWPKDLQQQHAYYQQVRSGLKACLDKIGQGGPSGDISNGDMVLQPKCAVKGYTSTSTAELKSRAAELLKAGYTVSLESSVACLIVKDASLADGQGALTLAGLKCE